MKLTKSQRLFVKVGEFNEEIAYCKWVYKGTEAPDVASRIGQLKKKRKKLLREAVLEAQAEFEEAYRNGWRDGFWDE